MISSQLGTAARFRLPAAGAPGFATWSPVPGSRTGDGSTGAAAVGITAAASTPASAVQAIIAALAERHRVRVSELEAVRETTVFKRMAIR